MKHGSLFSGIGGFDLAAEWMGWENVFHCEWNEFGQKILKFYWPNAISYADIKQTDFTIHRGSIDILTGGFPCQPFSTAGKRNGSEDDRYLWPETLRALREILPSYAIFENVFGLTSILESACETEMEIKAVQLFSEGDDSSEVEERIMEVKQRTISIIISQLEEVGYTLPKTARGEPIILCVPACAVNAPHRRDRIWFVAHSNSNGRGCQISCGNEESCEKEGLQEQYQVELSEKPDYSRELSSNPDSKGFQERISGGLGCFQQEEKPSERSKSSRKHPAPDWGKFPTQSPVCDGDDGLSSRLDGITFSNWRTESIKGGGNAIVPQVAFEIFKAIEQYEITA